MSDEKKDALAVDCTIEKELVEKIAKNPVLPSYLRTKLSNQEVPSLLEIGLSFISKSGGSAIGNPAFGEMLFKQLLDLVVSKDSIDQIRKDCKDSDQSVLASKMILHFVDRFSVFLEGINPKDQIEGMLATQMIGIHHATMDALEKARSFKDPDIKNSFLNSSAKLSRTFAAQMEALNRHRGKGQQKMTVEHVHVNAGGQAIIGNVQSGHKKKKDGGVMGLKANNED